MKSTRITIPLKVIRGDSEAEVEVERRFTFVRTRDGQLEQDEVTDHEGRLADATADEWGRAQDRAREAFGRDDDRYEAQREDADEAERELGE